jgi:hypothetical protein
VDEGTGARMAITKTLTAEDIQNIHSWLNEMDELIFTWSFVDGDKEPNDRYVELMNAIRMTVGIDQPTEDKDDEADGTD